MLGLEEEMMKDELRPTDNVGVEHRREGAKRGALMRIKIERS